MASTNCLISSDSTGSLPRKTASPCRRALRLERIVPALVRGPRLLQPLIRLAAIFFEEVIVHHRSDRRLMVRLLWSRGTRPRSCHWLPDVNGGQALGGKSRAA